MICSKCNCEEIEVVWDNEDILDINANYIDTKYFILHAYCENCDYELSDAECKKLEKQLEEENY